MKIKTHSVIALLLLAFSAGAIAQSDKKIAIENFRGGNVNFLATRALENATVSISGPAGFFASHSVYYGSPSLNLLDFGAVPDGVYKYQITAALAGEAVPETKRRLNNGRAAPVDRAATKTVSQSGTFYVQAGQIKRFETLSDSRVTLQR